MGQYTTEGRSVPSSASIPSSTSEQLPGTHLYHFHRCLTSLANPPTRVLLLHKDTEALLQRQARWSLYLHLHISSTRIQACTHHMTCTLNIRLIHVDLRRLICNIRPSRRQGSGPPLRVVTADGARYVGQQEQRALPTLTRFQIRCSGFEASDDGRCTNCQRFQQECIFTPVSSQAQAFVPAHTAYPHLRNTGAMPRQQGGRPIYPQQGQPAIYGAHGQPLGPPMAHDPNYGPPPPHGYPMPPPGPYQGGPVYDDRGPPQPPHAQDKVSLKRLRSDESFQPAPPPPAPPEEFSSHPYPGHPPAPSGRRGSGGGYEYPDPTGLVPVSPASSATSFQSAPYPPQGQPYYPPPPQQQQPPQQAPQPRRTSPQSAYSYDQRASGSPHGSTSSASGYNYPSGLHPPQVLPPRDQGRTPPPAQGQSREGNGNGSAQRGGMAVRDLLGPGGQNESGGRSSADSDMLRALNKKGPN